MEVGHKFDRKSSENVSSTQPLATHAPSRLESFFLVLTTTVINMISRGGTSKVKVSGKVSLMPFTLHKAVKKITLLELMKIKFNWLELNEN